MQRRSLIGLAGATAIASACRKVSRADPKSSDEDVGPVEDLMREHGVIRRALVVYRECAKSLRTKPPATPLEPLYQAATLMRRFGEDYHERQLEEARLFPDLKRAGGAAAAAVGTLLSQHERGREITEYVLWESRKATDTIDAGRLAGVLDAFARMYEEHAAFEDTVVFPAWKKTMDPKQQGEAADLFERIERDVLGPNGFEEAASMVGMIEQAFGVDLAAMTAPAPPAKR